MAYDYVTSGAKIGFKTGLQETINNMILNQNKPVAEQNSNLKAAEGTFYLTKDSHRLYVGNNDGSLSCVNEGITIISRLEDLPNATTATLGQFYYISGSNVLAVCASSTNNQAGWIQINAEQHTTENNFSISEVATAKASAAANNQDYAGDIFIQHVITDNNNNDLTAYLKVEGENGVTVDVDTDNAGATSGNIHQNVPVLKITGDQYEIDSVVASQANAQEGIAVGDAVINLESDQHNDSKIILRPGEGSSVSFATAKDSNQEDIPGVVVVNATDSQINSVTITNHSTGTGGDNQTGYTLKVEDSSNNFDTADFNPSVVIGSGVTTETKYFDNNTLTLPVYTQAEIDNKLKALNAMTYIGTVGSKTQNSATVDGSAGYTVDSNNRIRIRGESPNPDTLRTVKIGDTFLLSSPLTIGGRTYSEGTIIIANGTEGIDGNIESNYSFDIIEAANDTDSQYQLLASEGNNKGFRLYNVTGSAPTGEVRFVAGTATDPSNNVAKLTITESTSGSGDSSVHTITLDHAVYSDVPTGSAQTKQTADIAGTTVTTSGGITTITPHPATNSYTAITGITVDKSGHVSGWQTKELEFTDSNSYVDSFATASSDYDKTISSVEYNVGVIENQLGLAAGDGSSMAVEKSHLALCSSTLDISSMSGIGSTAVDANNIGALKIEMTWGSF